MDDTIPDDTAHQGDKVRLKGADRPGARGVVVDVTPTELLVRLSTDETLLVDAHDVTNFSLAARRAWRVMPDRAVGRPRSQEAARKRAVSLRVDADVWDLLGQAVERGLVPSREHAVNQWVREQLAVLLDGHGRDATAEG